MEIPRQLTHLSGTNHNYIIVGINDHEIYQYKIVIDKEDICKYLDWLISREYDLYYQYMHENRKVKTVTVFLKDIAIIRHIVGYCNSMHIKVHSIYHNGKMCANDTNIGLSNELIHDIKEYRLKDFKPKYVGYLYD